MLKAETREVFTTSHGKGGGALWRLTALPHRKEFAREKGLGNEKGAGLD